MAPAAVTQLSAQLGEAYVDFADQRMQALALLQTQIHQNAAQMQQLMAGMTTQAANAVPTTGSVTGLTGFPVGGNTRPSNTGVQPRSNSEAPELVQASMRSGKFNPVFGQIVS